MKNHIKVTASASTLSSVLSWPLQWWVEHNTPFPSLILSAQYLNKVELDLPLKKVLFPYEKTTMRTHFKYVERDPKGNWPGKMTGIANGFVSSRKFLTCDQAFFVLFCFFCFCFFGKRGKQKGKKGRLIVG